MQTEYRHADPRDDLGDHPQADGIPIAVPYDESHRVGDAITGSDLSGRLTSHISGGNLDIGIKTLEQRKTFAPLGAANGLLEM